MFFLAGLFSAVILLVLRIYCEKAATAIASGVASLFATPIMNFIADTVSLTMAMIIPIGFGCATYLVFRFMYRKPGEKAAA